MIYLFKDYELDTNRFEFRHAGVECKLTPKVFDLLRYLIENRDRALSRQELQEWLWPGQYVTNSSLNHCVMEARKAIDHEGEALQILQTVRHRGYRFMAPVVIQQSTMTARSVNPPALPTIAVAPLLPLLGRMRELTLLAECLAQVKRGQGHVVELVGPAGIGKSRLVQEFCQRQLQDGDVKYVHGGCHSYGRLRPFLPVRELLQQWYGMTAISTPTMLAAQLRQHFTTMDLPQHDAALVLAALFGYPDSAMQLGDVDPDIAQEHIYASLVHLFLQESQHQPLVLMLEDVHWIDPSSENWLQLLIERMVDVPLLLLLSYRPEYQPRWATPSSGSHMLLQPLSLEESRHLVHTLLPPAHAADDLTQELVVQAEGNPLALEMLTRTVVEQGEETLHPAVPETLAAAILHRMSRLSPAAQELLHTAAVFDGVWEMSWLVAMWDGEGEVTGPLTELQQGGWCSKSETGVWYAFMHTMFQEIVYENLAAARRQELHRRVGDALQALQPDESMCERLAYHYARANVASKAFDTLQQAIDRAAQQYAYAEAVLLLQEARRWGERFPALSRPQEGCFRGRFHLAKMLHILGQPAEALALLADQERGRTAHQHVVSASEWALLSGQLYSDMGEWQRANEQASQVLADTSSPAPGVQGLGHAILARGYYWTEQHLLGVEHGRQAVAHLRQTASPSSLAWAYFLLGLHYLAVGEVHHALAAEATVETLEKTFRDPHLLASATWATGCIHALCGNAEAAIIACQRSLEIAPDKLTSALASGWLGYARLKQGTVSVALECLPLAIATLDELSYQRQAGLFTVFLGAAHLRELQPQLSRAQALVLRGLEMTQASQYRTGTAWAHRVLGQIALAQADWPAATRHLQAALELFTALAARLEMGRTHLALGELARRQHYLAIAREQGRAALELFRPLQVDTCIQQATQLLRTVS